MTERSHLATGRLLGLAMLASAGVFAAPRVLLADPAASPAPGAPPLTVPRLDVPDVATRRARNLDARIERLHAALQLAPAQDKLWPPVASAMHDLAEARGRGFRDQLAAVADPVDGLKMQGDHMSKVGAAMARLADATKPLVVSFTADQKGRLPTLMERAPLRKVASRAFGVRPETSSGTPGGTPSVAPSGDAGAAQPRKDKDKDDDE